MSIAKSSDLTEAQATGEAVGWDDAKGKPGVYRLSPPFRHSSAVMVTTADGRNLYVNDGWVEPFDLGLYSASQQFWPTAVEPPDDVEPD